MAAAAKRRKYDERYFKFSFIYLHDKGMYNTIYVPCSTVLQLFPNQTSHFDIFRAKTSSTITKSEWVIAIIITIYNHVYLIYIY